MELAIAMLNAPMISSSFMERPILRTGKTIRVTMDPAVRNLMFGRLTNGLMLTLPTPAKLQVTTDASQASAETAARGRTEFATKTDAI